MHLVMLHALGVGFWAGYDHLKVHARERPVWIGSVPDMSHERGLRDGPTVEVNIDQLVGLSDVYEYERLHAGYSGMTVLSLQDCLLVRHYWAGPFTFQLSIQLVFWDRPMMYTSCLRLMGRYQFSKRRLPSRSTKRSPILLCIRRCLVERIPVCPHSKSILEFVSRATSYVAACKLGAMHVARLDVGLPWPCEAVPIMLSWTGVTCRVSLGHDWMIERIWSTSACPWSVGVVKVSLVRLRGCRAVVSHRTVTLCRHPVLYHILYCDMQQLGNVDCGFGQHFVMSSAGHGSVKTATRKAIRSRGGYGAWRACTNLIMRMDGEHRECPRLQGRCAHVT